MVHCQCSSLDIACLINFVQVLWNGTAGQSSQYLFYNCLCNCQKIVLMTPIVLLVDNCI